MLLYDCIEVMLYLIIIIICTYNDPGMLLVYVRLCVHPPGFKLLNEVKTFYVSLYSTGTYV